MNDVYLFDSNAVLRYLLRDISEQAGVISNIIKTKQCFVTIEVMSEVSYVLEGVYQVPRDRITESYRKLLTEMSVVNADIFLRAIEAYTEQPKLDFIDCVMIGYYMCREVHIVTFDKKLKSKLHRLSF